MGAFRVLQIDDVEFFVPDRHAAAAWYKEILGLQVIPEFAHWGEKPGQPLIISSDNGNTKLALSEGQPQEGRPTAGFHLVAFRVSAEDFAEFLRRLEGLELKDHRNRRVTPGLVVDHEIAYSLYLSDPYGHRLEVSTYDYEATREALAQLQGDIL